jgi:hypothetical protein
VGASRRPAASTGLCQPARLDHVGSSHWATTPALGLMEEAAAACRCGVGVRRDAISGVARQRDAMALLRCDLSGSQACQSWMMCSFQASGGAAGREETDNKCHLYLGRAAHAGMYG